jgi:hypothetical protein
MLFGVRRYYPSIAFPYSEGQHPEFSKERGIIYDLGADDQGKEGQTFLDSQIAHEILHLYGAVDLIPSKFPPEASSVKDVVLRNTAANDVMAIPTQHAIDSYSVGPFTAYLVGWSSDQPGWLSAGDVAA